MWVTSQGFYPLPLQKPGVLSQIKPVSYYLRDGFLCDGFLCDGLKFKAQGWGCPYEFY